MSSSRKLRRSAGRAGTGLRVVAGDYRGRRLRVPEGCDVRPTADRVREALFSSLGARIPGASVVDVFAGTGALGLEALSRGADQVAFIDNGRRAVQAIRDNLESLGAAGHVVQADALNPAVWSRLALPVDVVLADPPYGRGLAPRLLQVLADVEALAPGGVVVVEHEAGMALDHPAWSPQDRRRYGDTEVSVFALARSAKE